MAELKRIQWDPSLATGYSIVDTQHQVFIQRIDSFLDKCTREGVSAKELDDAFSFLFEYAETHFSTEEDLMRRAGYSGHETHTQNHKYLLDQLNRVHDEWQDEGPGMNQLLQMNYLLVDWLRNHIMQMDKKMAQSVRESLPE